MTGRKRCGTSEVDPRKFPVRAQGPETGLVRLPKYHSKTCMDENSGRAPSGVGKTSQQKRHSTKSVLKNGGPDKDRTCDLLHAMQALSQLSYRPLMTTYLL